MAHDKIRGVTFMLRVNVKKKKKKDHKTLLYTAAIKTWIEAACLFLFLQIIYSHSTKHVSASQT